MNQQKKRKINGSIKQQSTASKDVAQKSIDGIKATINWQKGSNAIINW